MFCQAAFDQWLTTIMHHLSHLSKPQATVLALWSFGMVLARSCALSAVSSLLAEGMQRPEQTVRQRLREWYYDAPRKRGRQAPSTARGDLLCGPAGLGRELVAGHATGVGHRCHDLGPTLCGVGGQRSLSWLCHPGRVGDPARERQTCLATGMAAPAAPAAPRRPPGWTVIVLADRGLYAPWLFRRITRLGWHPFLRINTGGSFRPAGATCWRPLTSFVPQPGTSWRGTGLAFTRNQVPCTLLARWEEGYKDPWLILTDLAAGGQ